MANILHWADYLVFGVTLLFSVAIGIFYAARERKSSGNKTEQFFLAGRKMPILPVTVSIFVSWVSAITFIGDPVEVYYHGAVYMYIGIGYALACPVVAHIFAPFYYNLHITSLYEYLESRYHAVLRYLSCIVTMICTVIYLGIVLYGPSVALSQVTGVPVWISILTIGVVGTFYTTLGGMKAVLWVDTFQSVIMLVGVTCLLCMGAHQAGGFWQVLETASNHGRLNFLKVTASPFVRSSLWAYLFGGFFRVLLPYIITQYLVQRYCTLSSAKDASRAVYLNIPLYLLLVSLFTVTGLVMFAYYLGCDPLEQGRITTANQLVPLFMVDVFGFLPGATGLVLACLCSASLSTLSSALNGISANVLVDVVLPLHRYFGNKTYTPMKDGIQLCIAKIVSVVTGTLVTGIAFAVLYSEGDIFPMTLTITGVFTSPIGALFFMGKVCPFVDAVSASIGVFAGLGISIWWGLGAMLYPPPSQILPVTSDMCDVIFENISNIVSATSNAYILTSNVTTTETLLQSLSENEFDTTDIYGISPLLFLPLGFITTFVITIVATGIKEFCGRLCCKRAFSQQYQLAESIEADKEPV